MECFPPLGLAERYRIACGLWGVPPSEFWAMCPQEWWWLYDAKIGEPRYGSLTETEIEELYHSLNDELRKQPEH